MNNLIISLLNLVFTLIVNLIVVAGFMWIVCWCFELEFSFKVVLGVYIIFIFLVNILKKNR